MKYKTDPLEFNLKDWRERNNVSLRELSKLLSFSYNFTNQIEKGEILLTKKTANKVFETIMEVENTPKYKIHLREHLQEI